MKVNRRLDHEQAKEIRAKRFAEGIYGVVQKPDLISRPDFVYEPPGFVEQTRVRSLHGLLTKMEGQSNWRPPPLRCFYTGVILRQPDTSIPNHLQPWLNSKDHIVPVRRDIPGVPLDIKKVYMCSVRAASVVNGALGVAPMLVRLMIRRWLSTVPFERDEPDARTAHNVRWTVINMMDHFRHRERFPWSRNVYGSLWYPECQAFVDQMWKAEAAFLDLKTDQERDEYYRTVTWQF
jgi:hypothetical protein